MQISTSPVKAIIGFKETNVILARDVFVKQLITLLMIATVNQGFYFCIFRYLLPTSPSNDPNSAAAAVAAAARIRNSFAAAANSSMERTMSETSETMTNRFLNRKPYSPTTTTTTNVGGGGPSTTVNDNVSAFYHQQNLINSATNSSNECLNASRSGGGNSSSTAAVGQQQQQHHQTSADIRRNNRLTSASLPTQPYYPSHFMKGTVIQLANGDLKRVEDLNTEDFVRSAHLTNDLKIDSSTVVKIEEKSAEIVLLSFAVGELRVNVRVKKKV